jgi:putative transposase
MPDHIHLLITPQGITLEKAVGLIKGGFSHRLASKFTVWQKGFTDHRVRNRADFDARRYYIRENPVTERLVQSAEDYPHSSAFRKAPRAAEAEDRGDSERDG